MAGSVYILPPDRVHPVDLPFTKALSVFTKWGMGAGEYVRAMKQAQRPLALTDPASTAPVANLDGSFRDPGWSGGG
jgi:hypothetical protein